MSNSKKRKTRSQKERSAQRRTQQAGISVSQNTRPASDASANRIPLSQKSRRHAASTQQDTADEKHARHAERIRLMKVSIVVFAGLVTFQLALWGLDHSGVISLSTV